MDPLARAWLEEEEEGGEEEAQGQCVDVAEVLRGLRDPVCPRLSHLFLYDRRGSRLYASGVAQTAEYYVPRCEAQLLRAFAGEIVEGEEEKVEHEEEQEKEERVVAVVELGAGSGERTRTLVDALAREPHTRRRTVYVPIDISSGAAEGGDVPAGVEVRHIIGRFEEHLEEASAAGDQRLFLFLGSSLGNLTEDEGVALLSLVARHMDPTAGDRFVVGVDVTTDASRLTAAYNDARGITAAFTLNALRHANRAAGLNFDWRHGWRHVAEYRSSERAVVTHVEAVHDHELLHRPSAGSGTAVPAELVRHFAAGERIFIEQARKFSTAEVARLASRAGLQTARQWSSAHHALVELVVPPEARAECGLLRTPAAVPLQSALVLASTRSFTGNAVTAGRIARLLPACRVHQVDVNGLESAAALANELLAHDIQFVLGLHAYRAGRHLVDCGVPFAIVLGGTDVNVDLAVEQKRQTMGQAVQQAAAVVAFHPDLLEKFADAFPAVRHKAHLVPQSIELEIEMDPVSDAVEGDATAATEDSGTEEKEQKSRAEICAALNIAQGSRLILLPAGLRRVKDVLFAIDAFSCWHAQEVAAGRPPVELRIVGPELDAAYAQDVQTRLRDVVGVEYVGALSRRHLHAAMRVATVVVNTSVSEGQCNSILEAMLAGTPVVARSNVGNDGTVQNGCTGLLFNEPEQMVEHLRRLCSDHELAQRLATRARASVLRKHSVDAERAGYERVVRAALATAGPLPRDTEFLGLHGAHDDLYGTLARKQWHASVDWLVAELERGHAFLLAACPVDDAGERARKAGTNPQQWTIGHVAFSFDAFVAHPLRLPTPGMLGSETSPLPRNLAWTMYDSMRVSWEERWALQDVEGRLPDAHEYLHMVHAMATKLARDRARPHDGMVDPVASYLLVYALVHELWHAEDFVHTRNLWRLPLGSVTSHASCTVAASPTAGGATDAPMDVEVPGGTFFLGAEREEEGRVPVVFDCEKWAHPVRVKRFRISRCCVTNEEFAKFVDAGGYADERFWSFEGMRWLRRAGAQHPRNWERAAPAVASPDSAAAAAQQTTACRSTQEDGGVWMLRTFDSCVPLPRRQPVSHITFYEAEAYCAWAHRRLPTEAEWEAACCGVPDALGNLAPHKGRYMPWATDSVDSTRANVGLRFGGALLDVDALPASDSAWGVRQMLGNVWEWTATTCYPWPGYEQDFPYREQSAPWFGTFKVARGGCFCTPDLVLLRGGAYRSFYHPSERPELCIGFRTCALDSC